MFNDNMMTGGPEGKWMNRNTGELLYVMNSVMDGDSIILITDKGQLSGPDIEYFMNNYIKEDENQTEYKVTNAETGTVSKVTETKKQEPKKKSKLEKQDNDFLIDDIPYIKPQEQPKKQIEVSSKNDSIIKKLFDKIESKPKINLTLEWADFPKNEISTLVNFLDVDIKDISKFIETKFVNKEEISNEITKIIESNLK